MRLLHFADVHLDRPFVGMDVVSGRARRRELREAMERCLQIGREQNVDLITIGGDLWEGEHVMPDTLGWVRARLDEAKVPVVIVSGNHDPLSPGGPYDRAGFGDSVTVLPAGPQLSEFRLGSLSIWGMSWKHGLPLVADCLNGARVPADGRHHALLLHGTASAYFEGTSHCPFTTQQVEAAGFSYCLAGHLHSASRQDARVIYPGSPEPLAWSQVGRHTAVVIDFAGAEPTVTHFDVNQRRYVEREIDCTGAASSADIERLALEVVDEVGEAAGLCLRLQLEGRVQPDCSPDTEALQRVVLARGLTVCEVRDRTEVAFDLADLGEGQSVAREFVSDLRQRIERTQSPSEQQALGLAIELGLRALHGDKL